MRNFQIEGAPYVVKLVLVRHGETEGNVGRIVQGQLPGVLSERGRAQVAALGAHLKEEKFDAIYSSDLARVKDTLAAITEHQETPVTWRVGLREKAFGVFEGKPAEEYFEAFKQSGLSKGEYSPPGGESFNDVLDRVRVEFLYTLERHPDGSVLWCTHGGIIRCALAMLHQDPIDKWLDLSVFNTSMTTFYLDSAGRLLDAEVGEVPHLTNE